MNPPKIRIGVIGCGYWGPNHIRNFQALSHMDVEVVVAADRDAQRRKHVSELYPSLEIIERGETIIEDESIDAVVLATPVSTHYPLAKAALEAGKHVLVEKPLVTVASEAEELLALAERQEKTLMVGHTFEYASAVNHIRHVIEDGELGDILYVRSLRVNLGIVQSDASVLWDLAPHDVSILLYVLQQPATAVSAVGTAHYSGGLADVTSINIEFGPKLIANIVCSWLDPKKVREMTIVGSKKMLVYDDVSANEKVRIYDRGVDGPRRYDSFGEFQYSYRYGDIVSPHIEHWEPLREECAHFIESIRTGRKPRSSGEVGLSVVRILTAAERSLRLGGARVAIEPPEGAPEELGTVIDLTGDDVSGPALHVDPDAKRYVLVVGADQTMLGFVSRALDAFAPGYEVVTATDIGVASKWLEVLEPQIVILGDDVVGDDSDTGGWIDSVPFARVFVVGEEAKAGLARATYLPKPLQLPSLLTAVTGSPV